MTSPPRSTCSTTSIYRLFSGKAAILAAVYRRAADRVSGDLSSILATADGPRDAVGQLAEAYVRRSFANPELAYVYYAERLNVPTEDRVALHNIQCATVDAWARRVAAVDGPKRRRTKRVSRFTPASPSWSTWAGSCDYAPSESALAVVRHLVLTTLLG